MDVRIAIDSYLLRGTWNIEKIENKIMVMGRSRLYQEVHLINHLSSSL